MDPPLRATEAKALARRLLSEGSMFVSSHCQERMVERNIALVDIVNTIRGGIFSEAEWENDSWRYTASTSRYQAVICFEDETLVVLVTAWRKP